MPDKIMKKIAIYIASLRGGGAEKVMLTLAGYFKSQGLRVDLVLTSAEGPYLEEVPADIRVVNLNKKRVAFSFPALIKYLKQEKPDLLLSAVTHVNLVAVIAKLISGSNLKLIISEHSTLSIFLNNNRNFTSQILFILVKFLYGRADAVVAVSKGISDFLTCMANISPGKLIVINNPIDTGRILRMAKEPLNHPWFSKNVCPVILSAGRLSQEKEFGTLIKAFARLLKQRKVRLIILGDGPERANLEKVAQDLSLNEYIDMPGFVSNPYAYMSRASVFVLTSSREGLPNVLLEALACGCPVVSTDCPSGPSEILVDGKYGALVPVGDIEAIVQAVIKTLDDPPGHEFLFGRAEDFSLDKIGKKYLDVILGGSK